ncbi:hypothetical protein AtEden1_Chr1g0070371 [Arabidopsis thaliana]
MYLKFASGLCEKRKKHSHVSLLTCTNQLITSYYTNHVIILLKNKPILTTTFLYINILVSSSLFITTTIFSLSRFKKLNKNHCFLYLSSPKMAETTTVTSSLKRQRDEQEQEIIKTQEETKRQKPSSSSSSYNQVLTLLKDEAENDITSLITTLQQEISNEEQNAAVFEENPSLSSSCSSSSSSCTSKEDEYDGDKEKVMKHLLEATDDELGIPNTEFGGSNYEMIKSETSQDYVNGFSLLDGFSVGLWELEDEAANYYTLLQSELFM